MRKGYAGGLCLLAATATPLAAQGPIGSSTPVTSSEGLRDRIRELFSGNGDESFESGEVVAES